MKKEKRAFSSNSEFLNHGRKEIDYNVDKNCLSNIKARVLKYELVHGTEYNEEFVEYWIEITTDYKKWIVKKRFSEFYELNKKLSIKMPELNKLFPPKRFFKTSEKTSEERKSYFNKYLQYIFKNKNIFTLDELLDFIQIEQKIIELYLKKHTMVKRDPQNITYKALKQQFDKMSTRNKTEKSKSVGYTQSLATYGTNSISTKINSIDEINKGHDYFNLNKINKSIIESCDSVHEVEELNTNYYSTLLDFEQSNLQNFDTQENQSFSSKESGTIVIQEFLKNLSQDIDNKTDIVKLFEAFLKDRQEWPKFSNTDIIKLFVGNNNDVNLMRGKKRSFNAEYLPNFLEKVKSQNFEKKKSTQFNDYIGQLNEGDIEDNNQFDNCIYKGLFHYIGEFDKNIMLSISCLNFLVRLLDNEFNPEVELYLKLFKSRKITDYQLLRLEEIIKYNKGGVQSANNAIKLLSILTEDKSKEYIMKYFIKDENIIKKLKYK